MSYAQVTLIVEGALEEEREFTVQSRAALDPWLDSVETELIKNDLHGEVYVIWHDHEHDVEDCACVQYLTDHHPYRVLNDGEED